MNGLIWVILIFVLQAVIAALAKRAQKNAELQAAQKAQGSPRTGAGAGPVRPLERANPASATNPTSSAVLPPRPTVVERGPISASVGGGKSSTKPASLKVVRPTTIAPGGTPRGSAAAAPPRAPASPGRKLPPTASARPPSAASAKIPPKVVPRPVPISSDREEAEAMSSRAKVAQSVAKIRSIESSISGQHVAGLGSSASAKTGSNRASPHSAVHGGVHGAVHGAVHGSVHGAAALGAMPSFSAARIAETFRNPHRVREAIILAEVIGPPRGAR